MCQYIFMVIRGESAVNNLKITSLLTFLYEHLPDQKSFVLLIDN